MGSDGHDSQMDTGNIQKGKVKSFPFLQQSHICNYSRFLFLKISIFENIILRHSLYLYYPGKSKMPQKNQKEYDGPGFMPAGVSLVIMI